MEASLRPWFTTGIALVGASAIVMAPVAPIAPSALAGEVRAVTATVSTEFHLTALDLPYILTLPIVRQQIRNWAENWAVYLAGFGKAGVGLAQSLLAIPGVTVEVIQQVLALDLVGAFDTIAAAARDSVIAVGQPLLDSLIWRNQKAYAVQTALQAAIPQAYIDVINGFLLAANGVTTSLIQGTQDFIAAVLTLNLGNIVDAALDGTRNFVVALGAGAGTIVTGIEAAQFGIATALATPPPAAAVADVSVLRTFSTERMVSLTGTSDTATLDDVAPIAEVTTGSSADLPAEAPVLETPGTPVPTEAIPAKDVSLDVVEPVDLPKTPIGDTPAEDESKDLRESVAKVTAGDAVTKDEVTKDAVTKDAVTKDAVKKDEGTKGDSGTAAKPASEKGGAE